VATVIVALIVIGIAVGGGDDKKTVATTTTTPTTPTTTTTPTTNARAVTSTYSRNDLGFSFEYPAAWGRKPIKSPGLVQVRSGSLFCNTFREVGGAPRDRSQQGLLNFGNEKAKVLQRNAKFFQLRAVEIQKSAGGNTGVGIVEVDDILKTRFAGRNVWYFQGRDVYSVQCSAPPSRFASADADIFLPMVKSVRLS